MQKNYFLPLEKKDLEEIKKGETLMRIFQQDSLEPLPLFVVFVGKKKVEEEKVKPILENGDSATSIVLDNKQIKKIEEAIDVIKADYGDFRVYLLSKEEMEKRNKEKELK